MRSRDEDSTIRAITLLFAAALAAGCGGAKPAAEPARDGSAAVSTAEPAVVTPSPRPAAPAGRPRDVTFDDVKLDMEKGAPFTRDLLPKRVTTLGGERIRIRGYILPSFQQTGLTQFVLVRDNMECCFGPGAALHDCIVVRMQPGRTAEFSVRPVAVSGTFRIEELLGPDGKHLAIYAMDGEEVR
jgi:hypothetical protein